MNIAESRTVLEGRFKTHDGVSLFYRHWPAVRSPRRGAVVMFHRGHEHSARMAHLVDELDLANFDFFAWDARGHGHSPGARGFSPGFADSVRDVQTFAEHIRSHHGIPNEELAILAQSVGAVLVCTWVHDYAPQVRCLVLASPAFKVKLYVPFARSGLRLLQRLRGNFFVTSYVKAKFLTSDPQRQASYDSDPLISRAISVNILLALYEAASRVVADAHAITTPTQLLVLDTDWVVHNAPQHEFFERLGSTIKEKHVLKGFLHDTFGERDRRLAVDKSREFILRRFAETPSRPDFRNADRQGVTHAEASALAKPLSALTPRGFYWWLARLNIKLGGHLSAGIRLGHDTGFDSGSSLDYVYRNMANGRGILGRLIDRTYLDAIGWRGVRLRKLHIEELLRQSMDDLHRDGRSVNVLDVAAGGGRYVLDALRQCPRRPKSIVFRDYDENNVRILNSLLRERELADIACAIHGDAFDASSLAATAPPPTIGIVSGLYELFPENEPVCRSLAGLARAIEAGGYLIYTGQPWHPQLELIARTLTTHRGGSAWVMRRRTQAELDQLVAAAGFVKIAQRIDEWGIFTVSLARRLPAA